MSNATLVQNVSTTGILSGVDLNRTTVHEKAVADIVGMIRAKFEDESTRNFTIGKRAFEHAQWQRGNFPGYLGSDFDRLMRRLRDDVRCWVPISANSIKVAEWTYSYVLRAEVQKAAGSDVANALSMHEYIHLVGKALSFSKKDVEGTLVEGWIDTIKAVAHDRAIAGGRVTSEDFLTRIASTVKEIAAAKAATDPTAAARKLTSDAIKAKTQAVNKANTDITSSVSDALVGEHLTPDGVLSIVENVCKAHDVPLPSKFGFDPASCTIADCDLLASTMFQAGRFGEMRHLVKVLSKMVATVDKSAATAATQIARKTANVGAKVSA